MYKIERIDDELTREQVSEKRRKMAEEYDKLFALIQQTPKDNPMIHRLWKVEKRLFRRSQIFLRQHAVWASEKRRKFWQTIDDVSGDEIVKYRNEASNG